jgi:ferredoxin
MISPTDTPPEAPNAPDSERKGGCSAMPGSPGRGQYDRNRLKAKMAKSIVEALASLGLLSDVDTAEKIIFTELGRKQTAEEKRMISKEGAKAKRRRSGSVAPDEIKCIKCGLVELRTQILMKGWLTNARKMGKCRGVCPRCRD